MPGMNVIHMILVLIRSGAVIAQSEGMDSVAEI
jgi:hypothetical protein